MREIWEKNRGFILGVCAAILLGIIAREGWQLYSAARDRGVQEDFAAAAGDVAKLGAFARGHSGHPLAGAALLLVADKHYEAGDFKSAATAYDDAAKSLELDALLGRARLGAAISRAGAGDHNGAEAGLRAVQADASLPAAVRAEAAYHLATIAAEAGNRDEALKQLDEITKVDATGPWAQRGAGLRAMIESGAKPAPTGSGTPSLNFKPGN